jgi:hypothetical protein
MTAEDLLAIGTEPMVSAAGGAPPAAPKQNSLNLSMEPQKQTNWCWAAVSYSVNAHFGGTSWSQCRIAEEELQHADCCTNPQQGCNRSWFLQKALTRVGNLQRFTGGAKTFAALVSEIDNGLPLACRIGWTLGGGHFVAIDGYLEQDTVQDVDVCDPWFGDATMSYDTFVKNYQGKGSWTHSYTTRR